VRVGRAWLGQVDHVAHQIVQSACLALDDLTKPLVLVGEIGRLAQHLDRTHDRTERIAYLVRKAGRDSTQDGQAFRLVSAPRGHLQGPSGQTQALGQVPGEERHDRYAKSVEQDRKDEFRRFGGITVRRLIWGRLDPGEVECGAEQRVNSNAERGRENGPPHADQNRADETREGVK
jgi:hypothetical protein